MSKRDLITKDFALYVVHHFASMQTWSKEEILSEIDRKINEANEDVVRCKDCEHATFYSCKNDKCYRGIICEYQIGTDDENFFCAYGERKEDTP